MDDDESNQDLEENIFKKYLNKISYAGNVFQPIWIRCGSIFSYISNREFVLDQFNFVLRIGTLFWIIFLISQII